MVFLTPSAESVSFAVSNDQGSRKCENEISTKLDLAIKQIGKKVGSKNK